MLGKLIKYDLKSMSKTFIPVWILSPVIGLLLSFTARGIIEVGESGGSAVMNTFQLTSSGIVSAIMGLLFLGLMVGLFVMTLMFVIQRFWNGLLKEEGYLMFTLPVETWKLIVSKAVTATLVTCISTVIGIFSCTLLMAASVAEMIDMLGAEFRFLFGQIIGEIGALRLSVMIVLVLILSVLSVAEGIYEIYAAMALGQLLQTHRVLGACIWFIGFNIVLSTITGLISSIMNIICPNGFLYYTSYSGNIYGFGNLLVLMIVTVIELLVFHLITERVLATRLNLE